LENRDWYYIDGHVLRDSVDETEEHLRPMTRAVRARRGLN